MGYAISFTSLEPVSETDFAEIQLITQGLGAAYSWLSCEPIWFIRDSSGYLSGFSKPNFDPNVDDRHSSQARGLPDGTPREFLDGLCLISRRFGVNWQVGDDHSEVIGFICGGNFDDAVWRHFDALAETVSAIQADQIEGWPDIDEFESGEGPDDDNDGDPPIFRFPGRGD